MKPTGDPGPIGHEAVRACCPWHHPSAMCVVACIQAFTGSSVCFKNRITITHACPLWFQKGHVHVDVIWARADAIRVLEHLYAKKSKLPMQHPYGLCKGLTRNLYNYLKSRMGPVCDPYGPIRRMTVYGPNGRKPVSAFSHILYGARMDQKIF